VCSNGREASGRAGVQGPLTDGDLARLAKNRDAEGLSHELMDVSCCGSVFHEMLVAGRYAFIVPGSAVGLPVAAAVVNVQG
jgi:hypothetical protein